MDDKGKALGYAYGNSDTYTDPVTQKTVTNPNLVSRVLKGSHLAAFAWMVWARQGRLLSS